MAFDSTKLTRIAHGNGMTQWFYKTDDLAADVDTLDYFLEAIKYLNQGDFIFAHCDLAGTPQYGLFVVVQNDGTNIDVADINDFAAVNTD